MKKERLIKKAFTLVELLVVIAILGILATAGIVGFSALTKKATKSNADTETREVLKKLQLEEKSDLDGYIFKTVEGKETYYYTYEENTLVDYDGDLNKLAYYYVYPLEESLDNVTIYSTASMVALTKLNEKLALTATHDHYSVVCDATNKLTDLQVKAINAIDQTYHVEYSLTEKTAFIADSESAALYGTKGSSTDYKTLRAVNIRTAQEYAEFVSITNRAKGSSDNCMPAENNYYVQNTSKPIVALNFKDDIDLSEVTGILPIANWSGFDYRQNVLTLPSYADILIIVNGNNKTLYNMYSTFVGAISIGSSIKNIHLNYVIGNSTNYCNTMSKFKTNDACIGEHYHFGLVSNIIFTRGGTYTLADQIIYDNVKMSGQVYITNCSGCENINETGIVLGGILNANKTVNANCVLVSFNNITIFNETDDTCQITNAFDYGLLMGNPEVATGFISYSNITYTANNCSSFYKTNPGGNDLPYLAVIG